MLEDLSFPLGEFVKGPAGQAAAQQSADDGWIDDALAGADPLQSICQDGRVVDPFFERVAEFAGWFSSSEDA